jgi:hypothetical protein
VPRSRIPNARILPLVLRRFAVVALNQHMLSVAPQRYKAGALDYLDVLNAQKQLLYAQINVEQIQPGAAANLITLCKALGGVGIDLSWFDRAALTVMLLRPLVRFRE